MAPRQRRSRRQLHAAVRARLIALAVVAGKPGDARKLDAFLGEVTGLVLRGLAIDAAGVALAVVDLARFLGKLVADIVAIGLDLGAQLTELLADLDRHGRHLGGRCGGLFPPPCGAGGPWGLWGFFSCPIRGRGAWG